MSLSIGSAILTALKYVPTTITAIRAITPLKEQIKEAETAFPIDNTATKEVRKKINERKHSLVRDLLDKYLLRHLRSQGLNDRKIDILLEAFIIIVKDFKKVFTGLKNAVKGF